MASPSTNIKITATDKTATAFRSVNGNVAKMSKGVGALKGAFAGLAGAMAVRAFVNFANQQIKMADTIGKMATKLQISTSALQTFRFAGEQSGETMDTMDKNLIKFAKQLGEAQIGIGLAKAELKHLGIELKDNNGDFKSHEQVLNEVADAYRNMDNPARKMSSAMALFGRSGHVMVNMLSDGSDGLAKLRGQLKLTGGIIEKSFIRDAEEANDAMNLLNKTFGAMATRLLSRVSPAILAVTDAIQSLMGLDPTKTMSLKRLRDEYDQLDVTISKTANNIRKLENVRGDLFGLTKQDLLLEKQKLKELMQQQYTIEVQIDLHKQVQERQEAQLEAQRKQKEEAEKQKKLEERKAIALKEQDLILKNMSARQFAGATKAIAAQNQLNAEHEKTIELLEEEYSEDFAEMEKRRTDEIGYQNDKLREQGELYGMGQQAMREGTQAQLADLDNLKAKEDELNDTRISNAISTSSTLLHQMKGYNKSWFEASKALAIAESIMNTYKAMTSALNIQPPPVGIAFASIIGGLGFANVARIRSQKYQGKEMGGTVRSGQPYIVGEGGAELFTPGQTGTITSNKDLGGTTNITFKIEANDARGFDQLLQARRGLIIGMINKAMKQNAQSGIL